MRDEWFIRGRVPMTKSEVRAISLSRLELKPGAVLYDVGAGTGSVSIEAALSVPGCQVFAVERKPEAAELISRNREKFHAGNVTVVEGTAPEAFASLPIPTHAFLGGTAGRMGEILDRLLEKNPALRVVINVIALESLAEITAWLNRRSIQAEISSVQTARGRLVAGYHLMEGQNPVYILSFGGEESSWAEES